MFLIFLKLMRRDGLVLSNGKFLLNETALWSDMGLSHIAQHSGVTPVE